jgi:hypothetical protein
MLKKKMINTTIIQFFTIETHFGKPKKNGFCLAFICAQKLLQTRTIHSQSKNLCIVIPLNLFYKLLLNLERICVLIEQSQNPLHP